MEQAGRAGGDAPGDPGAEGGNASTLARRLRVGLVSRRPGGVGAPPGDTTVPRQELADVDVRSFAAADARLWNGADTGARSFKGLKARNNPHSRNARPDADDLDQSTTTSSASIQGKRRDGAPEGAPAPVIGPVISGRFRRWARPRGGPSVRLFAHQRLRALHPPRFSERDRTRRSPRAVISGRRSVGCLTIEDGCGRRRASRARRDPRAPVQAKSPGPCPGLSFAQAPAVQTRNQSAPAVNSPVATSKPNPSPAA